MDPSPRARGRQARHERARCAGSKWREPHLLGGVCPRAPSWHLSAPHAERRHAGHLDQPRDRLWRAGRLHHRTNRDVAEDDQRSLPGADREADRRAPGGRLTRPPGLQSCQNAVRTGGRQRRNPG